MLRLTKNLYQRVNNKQVKTGKIFEKNRYKIVVGSSKRSGRWLLNPIAKSGKKIKLNPPSPSHSPKRKRNKIIENQNYHNSNQ